MNTTKFIALGIAAAITITSASAMASDDGKELFMKKCSSCHSVKPGEHKIGPSLAGVVGRKAGSTDFTHYKAMKGANFTWNEALIAEWIANQKKFIKNHADIVGGKRTAMSAHIRKAKDAAAIIGYLKNPM